MKATSGVLAVYWLLACDPSGLAAAETEPASDQNLGAGSSTRLFGGGSQRAHYQLEQPKSPPKSTVIQFTLATGPTEPSAGGSLQWIQLESTKANGKQFRLWLLSDGYPPASIKDAEKKIQRYILQEDAERALEFRDRVTHRAVLPSLGGWVELIPRADEHEAKVSSVSFARSVRFLGLGYRLTGVDAVPMSPPPADTRALDLLPDVLVGVASNTRQKDEKRRYDNSDYDLVRLTRDDYREMFEAGMNCFKVDGEQLPWVRELDAFYWGISAADLPYPECLYRSTYLGPTLFLDEPAVCTRDYVLRPRLEKDASFARNLSPQTAFMAFQDYFRNALTDGAPQELGKSLRSRPDADPGQFEFKQENLFSWETMVSTSAYQLSQDPQVPAAMVFEPPGRIGTWRTLPELDMSYGCQIPVDDPRNLTDILYGFLRGAARLTDKSWGTSIYGAVDRADAFWFLTRGYDLGATRFFFWDNARLACVPYHECLALARNLRAHAENYPQRDLEKLNHAGEVAILLPPGYNLGHVMLGKGNLWGLGALNLERKNREGVKYRVVMGNFFAEIERCLRLGVAFDLLWDLPDLRLSGYREVVHVREDGREQLQEEGGESFLEQARSPARPAGAPPILHLKLSATQGMAPLEIDARAEVIETAARVYYTLGADRQGVCHNAYVAWELYGPNDEDYQFLAPDDLEPRVTRQAEGVEVRTRFQLKRAGTYRLRAATVDVAGRSTVAWSAITVFE